MSEKCKKGPIGPLLPDGFEMGGHVLRLKQVIKYLGIGRSTIYERMNPDSPRYDPSFPRPIRLSGGSSQRGATGWRSQDLSRWIDSRMIVGWQSGRVGGGKVEMALLGGVSHE